MMPLEITQTEARPSGIGPGDQLQAARIEKGLSIEEVANRMHLSTSILKSIEENDFVEITAPIFVKGYLRAYARIVSLDEEEMIQQYVDFYSEEDPPIVTSSHHSPQYANDSHKKWVTYIAIIVLGGLLAAWWWSNYQAQQPSDAVSLGVTPAPVFESEIMSDEVTDATQQSEILAASQQDMIASEDDNTPLQAQVMIESEAAVIDTAEALETVEPVVAIAATETVEALPESGETEIQPDRPTTEPAIEEVQNMVDHSAIAATVNRTAPQGSDILDLTIHVDTWADIKDSGGHRLAYDLLRADNRVTLTGQAPFLVFFGNGHGVELTFNNEEIDISPHMRNDNTARLTIGNN